MINPLSASWPGGCENLAMLARSRSLQAFAAEMGEGEHEAALGRLLRQPIRDGDDKSVADAYLIFRGALRVYRESSSAPYSADEDTYRALAAGLKKERTKEAQLYLVSILKEISPERAALDFMDSQQKGYWRGPLASAVRPMLKCILESQVGKNGVVEILGRTSNPAVIARSMALTARNGDLSFYEAHLDAYAALERGDRGEVQLRSYLSVAWPNLSRLLAEDTGCVLQNHFDLIAANVSRLKLLEFALELEVVHCPRLVGSIVDILIRRSSRDIRAEVSEHRDQLNLTPEQIKRLESRMNARSVGGLRR